MACTTWWSGDLVACPNTKCFNFSNTFLCLLCRDICRRVSSILAINICMYVRMYAFTCHHLTILAKN